MQKIIVLCGGDSEEREVSLRSGEAIFQSLDVTKYDKVLLKIESDNRWYVSDNFSDIHSGYYSQWQLIEHLAKINKLIIFIALHGRHGEDGRIQAVLESAGIAYTGSGVEASAIGMNKFLSAKVLAAEKLPSIPSTVVHKGTFQSQWDTIIKQLMFPAIIKPNQSGSSLGVTLIFSVAELQKAIELAFQYDSSVIIEPFIKGREFTCGVLGNTGSDIRALPVVEIIKVQDVFDYEAKYVTGVAQEICPAQNLTVEQQREIQSIAMRTHQVIGCNGLTRTDIIMDEQGFIHILEINTSPGMTEQSLCPLEIKAEGKEFKDLLDEIVILAQQKITIN